MDILRMYEMADYYQQLQLEDMYPWITQEGADALPPTVIDVSKLSDDEE